MLGASGRLGATLPFALPGLHGILHENVKVLRVVCIVFEMVTIPVPSSGPQDEARVAFLWNSETKARYPSRETLPGASCIFARDPFLCRRLLQRLIVVPYAPFLGDLVVGEGLPSEMVARAALAGGGEFVRVAVPTIVVSKEQHVAEATFALAFLVEALTRGPAAAGLLEFAWRQVPQFLLHVLQAGPSESYGHRGVSAVD